MNIFVTIEKVKELSFREVTYYTVRFEDEEHNLFIDFLDRMQEEEEYQEDLANLFTWLKVIGNEFGVRKHLFRHEGLFSDVAALPPPAHAMRVHEIPVNDIRLYCHPLNEHVVILFSGGIKTAQTAQECPNVSKYFNQANRLAKRINELFKEGEIHWNIDHTDILIDDQTEFEL